MKKIPEIDGVGRRDVEVENKVLKQIILTLLVKHDIFGDCFFPTELNHYSDNYDLLFEPSINGEWGFYVQLGEPK